MQLLSGLSGQWIGRNRFRLMPDDAPSDSTATAQLITGSAAGLTLLTYAWTHPVDGLQEGMLALGSGDEPGSVLGLWGDSWHQKSCAAQLRGTVEADHLSVGYEYAPGWQWLISLTVDGPDRLRWRMDNVVPTTAAGAGSEEPVTYWAMEAALNRA